MVTGSVSNTCAIENGNPEINRIFVECLSLQVPERLPGMASCGRRVSRLFVEYGANEHRPTQCL